MQEWQELIIEGVLGLAIYLIGVRGLREVLYGTLQRRWGPLAIQLLTFLLLLAAVAFFTVSALAGLEVVAAVLALLTVTALSLSLREYGKGDSEIALWFEEWASEALNLMPRDKQMNTRGLMRIARALNSYGYVRTVESQGKVVFTERSDQAPFLIYDYARLTRMVLTPSAPRYIEVTLEVRPSLRPPKGSEWNFPVRPLRMQGPGEKWRGEFWLPVSCEFLDFWEAHMDIIRATGQLLTISGDSMNLEFTRNVRPRVVVVGAEEFHTNYLEFRATFQPPADEFILRYSMCSLIHPADAPSMWWPVEDICMGRWEFQVQSNVPDGFGIWALIPIASSTDVVVPQREIRENFGRIILEPAPDSLILPTDAIMLMFSPIPEHSGH